MTDKSDLNNRTKRIFIVADATGSTAERVVSAALAQFEREEDVIVKVCPKITTIKRLDKVIQKVGKEKGMIVYTLVSQIMRQRILSECRENNIVAVGLLDSLLEKLSPYLDIEPKQKTGLLQGVDENYYKKIDALGFAVKHDDGQNIHDLNKSDIILTGVSRTGKTPTSITLAREGWLVSNVPIVMETPPPDELFRTKKGKVVALTMDAKVLSRIRCERAQSMAKDVVIRYSDLEYVRQEARYSRKIFRSHEWPIVDVTNRAIEEIVDEVVALVIKKK